MSSPKRLFSSIPLAAGLSVFAFFGGLTITAVSAQQTDAVENLQQQLKSPVAPGDPQLVFDHRKEALMEAAAKLETISQLRLALALSEWKDADTTEPKLAEIDQMVRAAIGQRLESALRTFTDQGSAE